MSKRCRNWPIQYILGNWHFRNLKIKVKRPVLIPRPETEILVDIALNTIKKDFNGNQLICLEVGFGSGVIMISLIKDFPNL